MNLTLYTNASEKAKVDKALTAVATLTGNLRESCSETDPVILIYQATAPSANYMYITEFGRYYFITDITSVRNGLWQISGHVDVLMTYRSQIRTNTAIIRRQENLWNMYIDDGMFKAYANPYVKTIHFPDGFTAQEFVLAVAGS